MKSLQIAVAMLAMGLSPVNAISAETRTPSVIAATKGSFAYTAFVCSHLFASAGNAEEARRTAQFGIEQGREFLEALAREEVTDEDFRSIVPLGVSLTIQGPSDDFRLGRMYESALDTANDRIRRLGGAPEDLSTWPSFASLLADQGNCNLIGR